MEIRASLDEILVLFLDCCKDLNFPVFGNGIICFYFNYILLYQVIST